MIIAYDLGSARIGRVCAPEVLPLRPLLPATIHVTKDDNYADTIARLLEPVEVGAASRIVVEHAPKFYAPPDASPQAVTAMAHAHEACSVLLALFLEALRPFGFARNTEDHPSGNVIVLARASWAHRVVPHHKGGITDAQANEGLRAHVTDDGWASLADQDQRDAAGAIVGVLLREAQEREAAERRAERDAGRDSAKAKRVRKPRGPREKKPVDIEAQRLRRRKARGVEERIAKCNCGPGGGPRDPSIRGRHPWTCAGTKLNGIP